MGSQNNGKQVLKYAKMICICNIYTNSTSAFTRSMDIYFCFQMHPDKEYLGTHFKLLCLMDDYMNISKEYCMQKSDSIAQSGTKKVH